MINTLSKEQYKILLEQKSTCYIFPSDIKFSSDQSSSSLTRHKTGESENEWELVAQEALEKPPEETDQATASTSEDLSKLFPAAKARLLSLRDLGAKKIGNLKMKLAESRNKSREKEKNEFDINRMMHENVSIVPELLTTSTTGPFFTVQNTQNKNLLGAIHGYSSTLSVS